MIALIYIFVTLSLVLNHSCQHQDLIMSVIFKLSLSSLILTNKYDISTCFHFFFFSVKKFALKLGFA